MGERSVFFDDMIGISRRARRIPVIFTLIFWKRTGPEFSSLRYRAAKLITRTNNMNSGSCPTCRYRNTTWLEVLGYTTFGRPKHGKLLLCISGFFTTTTTTNTSGKGNYIYIRQIQTDRQAGQTD